MSKYVLPAEKIVKGLEKWLQVCMNDLRTAGKALTLNDEEQHKAALMVGHCYVFAIKSAHDALFNQDKIDPSVEKTLTSPEKRVLYYANKLVDELDKAEEKALSLQPELPGIRN